MQITVVFDGMEEFKKYMGGAEMPKTAENLQKPAENVQKPQETVAKPEPAVPATAPAPEPKKVTMEMITEKAIKLMDAGRQADLQALLGRYGVIGLPSLQEDKWAEFYAQLEVM